MGAYRDHLAAKGSDLTGFDNGEAWRNAGYTGPLNDAGDPAQEEDCDPRVWEALKTPITRPRDPR